MKFLKLSLVTVLVVAVILALAVYFIDVNQYKDDIITAVEQHTGRSFTIEGDLGLALSLVPTVRVEEARLGNADWGSAPDMATIGRFEARLALLPLLQGNIQVNRLLLADSDILLETDDQGRGNWILDALQQEPAPAVQPDSGTGGLPPVNISEIMISNVRVTYRDGVTGNSTLLAIDTISSHTRSFNDPTDLTLNAAYNGIPVTLTGMLGPLAVLVANDEFPIRVQITADALTLDADGSVKRPLEGKGVELSLRLAAGSLADISTLAGTDLPALGPLQLAAVLIREDQDLEIRDLDARLGDSDLTGKLLVTTTATRPVLQADLHSRLLDLSRLGDSGDQQAAKPEPAPARVFSDEELPLDALGSVDANISYQADAVRTAKMELDQLALTLSLEDRRLRIEPFSFQLAGGAVDTSVNLDAASTTPTLASSLRIQDLELGLLPPIAREQALVGGKTNASVDLHGSGSSVAAIMAGLNGHVLVQVGRGTLANSKVDLVGADLITETLTMINPLAQKSDTSELECAVVNLNIADGRAVADRGIGILTGKMSIVGDGTINLADETLDLSIRPRARTGIGIGLGSLASLVKLGGTLADPKPVADAGAVLEAGKNAGTAITNLGRTLLGGGSQDSNAQNPCDVAMGTAPATAAETAGNQAPAATDTERKSSAVNTVGDTVKGAADKVKGALKGLFGN